MILPTTCTTQRWHANYWIVKVANAVITKIENRWVEDCVILSPRLVEELHWMPSTCAYRLIYEGKDLYWWHPLISGSPNTVHEAGISVRGRVISEREVKDSELPKYIDEQLE